MGLDIGFSLYDKKKFDTEKILERSDVDDSLNRNWVCGRCDSTNSWGECFTFGKDKTIVPVFQKELDGTIKKVSDDHTIEYKLVPFSEFAEKIQDAVSREIDSAIETRKSISAAIKRKREKITALRELQKSCTKDQQYAFDRWTDEINELESEIIEDQEEEDTYLDDDYGYNHAKQVLDMLNALSGYLQEDKYYVIPYFSF